MAKISSYDIDDVINGDEMLLADTNAGTRRVPATAFISKALFDEFQQLVVTRLSEIKDLVGSGTATPEVIIAKFDSAIFDVSKFSV